MKKNGNQTLLDHFADELHCMFLSDLRFMTALDRKKLSRIIQKNYSAESASLAEWNDAIQYLSCQIPENSADTARDKLIFYLSGNEKSNNAIN